MATRPYKRLPGRSSGILNSTTLWQGDDHLLFVQTIGVTESYRRFFYRDIQAFVVCKTHTGRTTSIILAVLTLLCGLPAFFVGPELAIGLGILAGILLIATLITLALGPTCRCELRTAVQTQVLPSLNRLRKARKALLRLQPVIAEAQPETAQ